MIVAVARLIGWVVERLFPCGIVFEAGAVLWPVSVSNNL